MEELYTIGHSRHKPEYFVSLLKRHGIRYLLDVRSTPYSRFADQFNRETVREWLAREDITYSFMGKYFGARREDVTLYHKEGYLDFEKVRESELFQKGMENVILGLEKGNRVALMCTEKDPMDCHRAIMVARAFSLKGIQVRHILEDGSLQTQEELDKRLLDKYFPDRGQITLWNMGGAEDSDRLPEAYRLQNAKIGYRLHAAEKEEE